MKKDWEWHSLIARYQAGQLSDEEFAELEEALRNSKEVRAIYHQASRFDSSLRRESEQVVNRDEERAVVPFRKTPLFGRLAAAAAVVILSALTITIAAQKRIVATLVSSENAAWESALPTVEGAKLSRGSLRLSTGIATIRFDSGVELTLEAPARLFIKGSKRASLVHGTAILKSSDSDEFMLETQLGQAVSRDSEYIVAAGKDPDEQRFEVLSGEAWVSHDRSREAVKVVDGEYALLNDDGLVSNEVVAAEPPIEQFEQGLRISSESRSATFIRNDNPYKWTRPEFLTLKKSNSGNLFDQYCVVGFDLGMVNPAQVEEVTLRLNLVPSGIGLASRLPKVNRFAVYGLVNSAKEDWSNTDSWEGAPAPEDGKRIGGFEISRSQQEGTIEIRSEEILSLVKEKAGGSVSFIIVRETGNIEGLGNGLTHAIASGTHPEAAGPVLELSLKQ